MPMTLEQFGQTVKKKYPQYDSVSDTELGQRILDKYPSYQSQITAPQIDAGPQVAPRGLPLTDTPQTPFPARPGPQAGPLIPPATGSIAGQIPSGTPIPGQIAGPVTGIKTGLSRHQPVGVPGQPQFPIEQKEEEYVPPLPLRALKGFFDVGEEIVQAPVRGASLGYIDPGRRFPEEKRSTAVEAGALAGEFGGMMVPFNMLGKILSPVFGSINVAKKLPRSARFLARASKLGLEAGIIRAAEKNDTQLSRLEKFQEGTVWGTAFGLVGEAVGEGLSRTGWGKKRLYDKAADALLRHYKSWGLNDQQAREVTNAALYAAERRAAGGAAGKKLGREALREIVTSTYEAARTGTLLKPRIEDVPATVPTGPPPVGPAPSGLGQQPLNFPVATRPPGPAPTGQVPVTQPPVPRSPLALPDIARPKTAIEAALPEMTRERAGRIQRDEETASILAKRRQGVPLTAQERALINVSTKTPAPSAVTQRIPDGTGQILEPQQLPAWEPRIQLAVPDAIKTAPQDGQLTHLMPDGSVMAGPEHPRAVPGSETVAASKAQEKVTVFRGSSRHGQEKVTDDVGAFGVHFGTEEQALTAASQTPGGTVRKYELDLKNPLQVTDEQANSPYKLALKLKEMGLIDQERVDEVDQWKTSRINDRRVVNLVKSLGYDSLVYENTAEGPGRSYVALDDGLLPVPAVMTSPLVERVDGTDSDFERDNILLAAGRKAVPGIRMQEAREAGRMQYLVDKGQIKQADFDEWKGQMVAEGLVQTVEPKVTEPPTTEPVESVNVLPVPGAFEPALILDTKPEVLPLVTQPGLPTQAIKAPPLPVKTQGVPALPVPKERGKDVLPPATPIELPSSVEPDISKLKRSPSPTRILGLEPLPRKSLTEISLLKKKLRDEARGARAGVRIGRIETREKMLAKVKAKRLDIKGFKEQVKKYAKENLTTIDRERILLEVERVKGKGSMQSVMDKLTDMEDRYLADISRDDLKATLKGIRKSLRSGLVRPEYKAKISEVIGEVDPVKMTDKTKLRLGKLATFIEQNPDHNVPDYVLRDLNRLDRKPLGEMTKEEVDNVKFSLKHLKHLNDLKNKIIVNRRQRDFDKVESEAIDNVNLRPVRKGFDEALVEKEAGLLKRLATTGSLNAETIVRKLDQSDNGIIKKVFYDGIDQGTSDTLKIQQEARDIFEESTKDIDVSRWSRAFHPENKWDKGVDVETFKLDSGRSLRISVGEKIALYLHSLNKASRRHIFKGGMNTAVKPSADPFQITQNDLIQISKSMTPDQKKIAEDMYQYLNVTQKDHLNETSVKIMGVDVATESDYFPIRVKKTDVKKDYLGEAITPKTIKGFTESTLEGRGMFKSRVDAENTLLLEDAFSAVYKSIKLASAYSGMAEPLRSAKQLFHSGQFRSEISKRYGAHYWNELGGYLRDVEGERKNVKGIDELALRALNRLDASVLGLNPWVMGKQWISMIAANTEISEKYLLKSLNKPADKDLISKFSPQLRQRFTGRINQELGESFSIGETRGFWTDKSSLSSKMLSGIKAFDSQVITRIWTAVEFETKANFPNLSGDDFYEKVAKRTEEIVRLTQPTYDVKDRSGITRVGSTVAKIATRYSSQRNKYYNMIVRSVDRYNSKKNPTGKDKAKLLKDLATIGIFSSLGITLINALRDKVYRKKPKKHPIRSAAIATLSNNLSFVYVLGDFTSSVFSKMERGTYRGYEMQDILTSNLKVGGNLLADIGIALSEINESGLKTMDEAKFQKRVSRIVDGTLKVGSKIKGIPYETLKKLTVDQFLAERERLSKELPTAPPTSTRSRGRTLPPRTRGGSLPGRRGGRTLPPRNRKGN